MRVGGLFPLTALVIWASELFSRVMSAVQSPKHCLHTIKAMKRNFPRPVNAIMNQAVSVRHRIGGCSFCRLICVARHSRQPNAIIAQSIDSTLGIIRANMWVGLAGITSTCMDLRLSKWSSTRKLGYFGTETLRCGRDRRDLWGRSMFWCSYSASQWIVCYPRYSDE